MDTFEAFKALRVHRQLFMGKRHSVTSTTRTCDIPPANFVVNYPVFAYIVNFVVNFIDSFLRLARAARCPCSPAFAQSDSRQDGVVDRHIETQPIPHAGASASRHSAVVHDKVHEVVGVGVVHDKVHESRPQHTKLG